MLKSFFKRKPPTPFSSAWLSDHADRSSRSDFESAAKGEGAQAIYHVTSLECAQSIVEQGVMFGVDIVSAAHFHHDISKASGQAVGSGAVLGFVWRGPVKQLSYLNDSSTHADRRPNILFDAPLSEYDTRTWELRLYPGTTGLELTYVEISKDAYLLREPVLLRVIARY